MYVVVITAPDGTVSVMGDAAGQPFRTEASAQTTAALWDTDGRAAVAAPIETYTAPD